MRQIAYVSWYCVKHGGMSIKHVHVCLSQYVFCDLCMDSVPAYTLAVG